MNDRVAAWPADVQETSYLICALGRETRLVDVLQTYYMDDGTLTGRYLSVPCCGDASQGKKRIQNAN